jgi:hypothetical protein
MTAKSKSQGPRSEKANLPSDFEERSRLRAYRWREVEAEMLGAEKQPKVKAAKVSTRDRAVGEPFTGTELCGPALGRAAPSVPEPQIASPS